MLYLWCTEYNGYILCPSWQWIALCIGWLCIDSCLYPSLSDTKPMIGQHTRQDIHHSLCFYVLPTLIHLAASKMTRLDLFIVLPLRHDTVYILAWKPFQISLTLCFICSKDSYVSYETYFQQTRFSALIGLPFCPEKHIELTKLRSNCKTRQFWSDVNQDFVTAVPISASNVFRNTF